MNDPQTTGANEPWLDMNAFLRAVLGPLALWTVVVVGTTSGGVPGTACMTPLAWSLACWSAVIYVSRTRQPARRALWGPALVGATLGLGLGMLFAGSMYLVMARDVRPEEIAKGRVMTLVVVVAGVIVCPLLSTTTAWVMRRRLAQGR